MNSCAFWIRIWLFTPNPDPTIGQKPEPVVPGKVLVVKWIQAAFQGISAKHGLFVADLIVVSLPQNKELRLLTLFF